MGLRLGSGATAGPGPFPARLSAQEERKRKIEQVVREVEDAERELEELEAERDLAIQTREREKAQAAQYHDKRIKAHKSSFSLDIDRTAKLVAANKAHQAVLEEHHAFISQLDQTHIPIERHDELIEGERARTKMFREVGEELVFKLKRRTSECERLRRDFSGLVPDGDHRAVVKERDHLRDERDDLRDERGDLRDELDQVRVHLAAAVAANSRQDAVAELAAAAAAAAAEERGNLAARIAELVDERDRLKADVSHLVAQCRQLDLTEKEVR
ncbi:hypothetical protein JCM9279_003483, partial [Rhodotorula babjevae]